MSSRADTILRIAKTRGAQALSSGIGLLRVVWSMRVSARWHAAVPHVDIVEGWIIGAAKDKTFAPAQENLCQSPLCQSLCVSPSGNRRWLRKLRPADRGTSVPWRKPSDGRGEVAVAAATGQRHVVQLLADLAIAS